MNYVNASGQKVNIYEIAQKHKPLKSAPAIEEREDAFGARGKSDGFVVLGYSAEVWASIPKLHSEAIKRNAEKPTEYKHPGTLEEFTASWLRKNKPKRARSKPYEIESAADLCADLMRKAGWVHVRVEELLKG